MPYLIQGCFIWKNDERVKPVYENSKYNQMSECTTACKGSFVFLIQVLNEASTKTTYVTTTGKKAL